jgi:hypothetical protein
MHISPLLFLRCTAVPRSAIMEPKSHRAPKHAQRLNCRVRTRYKKMSFGVCTKALDVGTNTDEWKT